MYKDIAVSSVRGSLQAARDLIQMMNSLENIDSHHSVHENVYYTITGILSNRCSKASNDSRIWSSFVSFTSNVLSSSVFRKISSFFKEYPSHQQQSILSYKDAIEMQYSEMEYNIKKVCRLYTLPLWYITLYLETYDTCSWNVSLGTYNREYTVNLIEVHGTSQGSVRS